MRRRALNLLAVMAYHARPREVPQPGCRPAAVRYFEACPTGSGSRASGPLKAA